MKKENWIGVINMISARKAPVLVLLAIIPVLITAAGEEDWLSGGYVGFAHEDPYLYSNDYLIPAYYVYDGYGSGTEQYIPQAYGAAQGDWLSPDDIKSASGTLFIGKIGNNVIYLYDEATARLAYEPATGKIYYLGPRTDQSFYDPWFQSAVAFLQSNYEYGGGSVIFYDSWYTYSQFYWQQPVDIENYAYYWQEPVYTSTETSSGIRLAS